MNDLHDLHGYFKEKYGPLSGQDWLKSLPEWERKAFSEMGWRASEYGRAGGKARASTARRVPAGSREGGRFAPNEVTS